VDFLDELVSDQQFNDNVDQGLLAQIENLIWYSSLDDKDKARQMKKMLRLESLEGAMKMVTFLKEFQPIVGFHRAPMTQYESVEATRIRVDRENFQEERWNAKNTTKK
jgi:hypothetical protein